MTELSTDLCSRCRSILLKCSEFDSDAFLQAVFVTDELRPFRDRLPTAARKSGRVDSCVAFLLDQRLSDGRPVLPILLRTLRDRYQPGNALRDELDALASDVRAALRSSGGPTIPTPPPQIAQRLPAELTIQLRFQDLHSLRSQVYDKPHTLQVQTPFRGVRFESQAPSSQNLGTHGQQISFPPQATGPADVLNIPPSPEPALWIEDDFVGRQEIIDELLAAAETTRMVILLGILGIGKTALMAQIASRFDSSRVFGYRFRPGLISLGDILIRLARFLDDQPECKGILVNVTRASAFSEKAQIDLIIEALNKGPYYLFFDSIEHIVEHPELDSFFGLLKEHLQQGGVFVAGRTKPSFYTPTDEDKELVKSVELEGLHELDITEFFDRKDITLPPDVALDSTFGALPLALELMVPLLADVSDETEMLAVADRAREQAIDQLFELVYEQLDPAVRDLLTTASLLVFPFSRDRLLDIHTHTFVGDDAHACFLSLREHLLLQRLAFAGYLYQVHEVISELARRHTNQLQQHRLRLAEHLTTERPDEFESQLEAVLLYLQAEAYDKAAEVLVPVIDLGLLEYSPGLVETILGAFSKNMVSRDQWVWLIGNRGRLAGMRRQVEEAEHHYRDMLRLAEEMDDKAAEAIALQRLGVLHFDRDNAVAEEYYRESLRLKRELDDLEGQAQLHNNLGLIYIDRGQFTEAQSAFERAADLLEAAQVPEWLKLSNYANLGYLCAEQEQWTEADRFTKEALQIANEVGSPCDVAKLTYNRGIHRAWQGNPEAACALYSRALEIAEISGCWQIEELACIALGRENHESGDYDEAVSYFQRVSEIREGLGDRRGLASIIFDIGTFYWHSGDCERALDYYEQGIELFGCIADEEQIDLYLKNIYALAIQSGEPRRLLQALKDLKNRLLSGPPSCVLARVYGTLGDIYLRPLRRERVALAYMREEIALLEQLGRDREQIGALVDFAGLLGDIGCYGNALLSANKAIAVAKEREWSREVGTAYYNRGNCYANLQMWPEAEKDYHRSLDIAEEFEDVQLRDSVRHNLGEVYRRQGRPEEAIELLQASLTAARDRGDVEDEIRALNNLGLTHSALSQGEKALASFHNALELCRRHDLRHDEANLLIGLGNFSLNRELAQEARQYYEQALAVARAIGDIDIEEGSVLSLAYAHRKLGSLDEIEDDFKAVAERAGVLGHYHNLLQFLTFAGEWSFEEYEIDTAAEMFERALFVAMVIGSDRFQQLEPEIEGQSHFTELFNVIGRICDVIDKALQDGIADHAQALYDGLLHILEHSEPWQGSAPWIADILKPIGDYFAEHPEQSLWEFVASAWAGKDTEDAGRDS